MVLNLQQKEKIIHDINLIIKNAISAIVADFRNVNANKINELRKICRESDINVQIIKNSLLEKAIKNTAFTCLKKTFTGPTLIAFSKESIEHISRVFKKFIATCLPFEIKAGAYKNKLIKKSQIDFFADQPTYEEAILKLISVFKEASIGKLFRIFLMIYNLKKTIS